MISREGFEGNEGAGLNALIRVNPRHPRGCLVDRYGCFPADDADGEEGPLAAGFLALDGPWVAGEESFLAHLKLYFGIDLGERPGEDLWTVRSLDAIADVASHVVGGGARDRGERRDPFLWRHRAA